MDISTEAKRKHFAETALALRREGYTVEDVTEDGLKVSVNGDPLCSVATVGGITYRQENLSTPELELAKDKAYEIVRTTAEYMRQMEQAPFLQAQGLEDRYKLLADFNGTVLAGMESKFGVQFVTWDWDLDRTGVSHGNYYMHDYIGAKQNFATRSGLVDKQRLFSDEQLTEAYRCIHETLDSGYPITAQREKLLKELAEQIEWAVPDLEERVNFSNQQELEQGMTQQF